MKHLRITGRILFLWCLVCTPTVLGQTVFRSGVDLITLDVTVVDRDGRQVTGLGAADFVVKLDGHEQAVRTVDYLDFVRGSVSSQRAPTPLGRPTSSVGAPNTARLFVFLVDDLSFLPGAERPLTFAAERMIDQLDDDDLVGIMTSSGRGPVVNPTADHAAAKQALSSREIMGKQDIVDARFYIGVHEAMNYDLGLQPRGQGPGGGNAKRAWTPIVVPP